MCVLQWKDDEMMTQLPIYQAFTSFSQVSHMACKTMEKSS